MDDRSEMLGFIPQKECPYNNCLPYAEKLDIESFEQLSVIKANLAKTIQLRDIKIGASHWTGQLAKYMRLYGHKFSKKDHLDFINILYELTTIPDLEYSLVHKFAQQLTTLLKKRELLSRNDLVLPWRPLYHLLENVVYSRYEHHGLVLLPSNIENVLKGCVKVARVYFHEDCTQEMLNEWRPLLCPFDMTMMRGMYFLELFVPTCLPPELHHKGFKLWFDEMMGLWDLCQNSPSWEGNLVNMFARIANDGLGYIDWEPYLPKIFTRILRSFNLPVGSVRVQVGRNANGYEVANVVWWIMAMMGGGHSTQEHLNKLFKALESFFHPSNIGKWNTKLLKIMSKLPQFMVRRLHKERHKKTWQTPVPESHKLTDSEVTVFVESMKPIIFLAMFSRLGSQDSATAFQNLAILRPELIIPPLLERTYPALETLTEPHRLTACLQCLVACSRPMLGNPRWYPEGRMHVLPLLNLALPGIDQNDIKKCLMTFQLISTLVSLIPLVDCSEAVYCRSDLTENEKELCSATAQFEDFVLQFIDRVFGLIESSIQTQTRTDGSHTRLAPEEAMVEVGLLSTFNAIMQQSSTQIFDQALRRLFNFASTNVFEIRVAGRFTADLIRATVKVKPEKALKLFLTHFIRSIKSKLDEDISKDEHLDNELLWNLKLMSESVRCNGVALLPYQDDLIMILHATLHLRCKDAADLAGNMLRHMLRAISQTYATDYRSTPSDWDKPLSDNLPIRDWGTCGNIEDLQPQWHVPSQEEKQFAHRLLETFLSAELQVMQQHIEGSNKLSREELLQRLTIMLHILVGAGPLLPMWDATPLPMVQSMTELIRFSNTSSVDACPGIDINGENVRILVANSMRPLLDHMLATGEDDTKSFNILIKVFCCILYHNGTQKDEFDGRWKSLHIVKRSMENKLLGKKCHMRALLVDRAQLQHELRDINRNAKIFSQTHRDLFTDFLRLTVSRYSDVRKIAQVALAQGFHQYAYSYRALLDQILEYLSPDMEHHQLKGALHVILGENKRSLITKRSWDVMNKIWPALIRAQHSEKPSVLQLIDQIVDKLQKNVETTELQIVTQDSLLEAAKAVWEEPDVPVPALPQPSEEELNRGKLEEQQRNKKTIELYYSLAESLVQLIQSGDLRWKFHQMATEMLALLLRHDINLPTSAVTVYANNLVHESLQVRKICLIAVSAILKQQKRKHVMREIDPYSIGGVSPPTDPNDVHPGDRPDNMWHFYDKSVMTWTKSEWQSAVFIEKTHWGYYNWPSPMRVYAPAEDQPPVDRSPDEMLPEERPIYDCFTNAEFVDSFIKFLCLEENKGHDKFNPKHYVFFKGLFRNYGESVLPLLKPHLERLVRDTTMETHECSQRCGAEIIAGLIRGSKHWVYEKIQAMWEIVIPLVKIAVENITVESVADWGTCFATASESRDPRRLAPLFELLMDDPLRREGGSFSDSSRLYILQGTLAQQEWRVPQLLHRYLEYATPLLSHPYKNVRDRMGSTLVNVLMYDVDMPAGSPTTCPRRKEFIQLIQQQLTILNNHHIDSSVSPMEIDTVVPEVKIVATAISDIELHDVGETRENAQTVTENGVEENGEESEERKIAIKLIKTVMKWLQGNYGRVFQCAQPDLYSFLPTLCLMAGEERDEELYEDAQTVMLLMAETEIYTSTKHSPFPPQLAVLQQIATLHSESKDDELKQDCVLTMAFMAQALLTTNTVTKLLETIDTVAHMKLWHARAAILGFLQVAVFCNFFLLQYQDIKQQIKDLVIRLLCDEQLEVREMAAVTLGGFLHCGYIDMSPSMMAHFEDLCQTSVRRERGRRTEPLKPELLLRRHAGVLGLSACVSAFPYDVPEFMPQVLMDLGNHLNDPQPIQLTVKKTLSNFKRTHHDNWQDHKQKFTDDQLVVLTDLLVSPNYYA